MVTEIHKFKTNHDITSRWAFHGISNDAFFKVLGEFDKYNRAIGYSRIVYVRNLMNPNLTFIYKLTKW